MAGMGPFCAPGVINATKYCTRRETLCTTIQSITPNSENGIKSTS